MRTHASAADMMSLLQRLINCFVENLTVLPMQMLVQTLASVNHSSMESAHQNMSEVTFDHTACVDDHQSIMI